MIIIHETKAVKWWGANTRYMRKWVGRVMNNGVYLDKSSGKPLGF